MSIRPVGQAQDGEPRFASFAISFAPALLDRIEKLAVKGYPHETCGLLIGYVRAGRTSVEQVTGARNLRVKRSRDRYLLDPDDFLRAERRASELGLDVVGVWHSHPDHPPVPSQIDLEAAWPGYSYLVVSVAEGGVVSLASWRLVDGKFEKERLER